MTKQRRDRANQPALHTSDVPVEAQQRQLEGRQPSDQQAAFAVQLRMLTM